MRITAIHSFLAVVALAPLANGVAQTYPAKPIRTIMTVAGGGEGAVRVLSNKLAEYMGQPVIVEIQSAAGGAVGALAVARAPADGYTLAFATTSAMVMRPFLTKNTPYDTLRDFTPIIKLGEAVSAVIAEGSMPFGTINEMVGYARKNPGKLSYGSPGIGTTHHLSGDYIQKLTGIDMVHVPYKTGAQSIQDLAVGRIQVVFMTLGLAIPHIESGKMKLLAINSGSRFKAMPNVPTVGESIAAYDRPPGWMAYFGPANLPAPITRRLHAEINRGMNTPEMMGLFDKLGMVAELSESPEQFAVEMKRNYELAGRLVKSAGIEPE